MARESIGSPGDASSGMIIPVGGGQGMGSTRRLFPHLLDAISQIQQFYVIESTGEEIPDDFLTLRGKMNFANVGFGAGFFEALIFAMLMTLIMALCSDDVTRSAIAKYFPLINSQFFLWTINLSPVIISGGLCSYLSRYYVGKISKSAIDWLLMGRLFSLILKGLIIFTVFTLLANHITSHSAWTFASYASLKNMHLAVRIYYIVMATKPLLIKRAFEVLGIFAFAILMPFLTIWGVSWFRKVKAAKGKSLMEN